LLQVKGAKDVGEEFSKFLIKEAQVAVSPGLGFGKPFDHLDKLGIFNRLTVLSKVEGLPTLSRVEGQITMTKIQNSNVWGIEYR
jgi:hypothetical protein